jgi:hypothetical protein
MSLVNCPVCLAKCRIAASEALTNETRRQYCQCQNLNCGVTFTTFTTLEKVIRSPKEGSLPPDKAIQSDLVKDPLQMDLIVHEPMHIGA